MFWTFPLTIQTLDTKKDEWGTAEFSTVEEFTSFCENQFKLPGQYNLRNTKRWRDVGIAYSESQSKAGKPNFEGGQYTNYIKGTHKWTAFWKNEKDKVLKGLIVDNVYLPPFYYWYLNFCPIFDDILKRKKLPDVWDSDLWYMHYCMLAILKGKHIGGVKGRQKGYSYKHMAILYWSYCWFENGVNTVGAFKEDLVKKSWRYLEGYRKHINSKTAWKRGPTQPKSLDWNEVTMGKDNNPYGLQSRLSGVTFKQSPSADVGGAQTFFNYEEPGVAPTILETIEFIRPAVEKGSITTGIIIACGSVGDLDDAQGLKEIFYKPTDYNFLPVKNIWDTRYPTEECCIFISEAYNLLGRDTLCGTGRRFFDEDGNSDVELATQWIEANNKKIQESSKQSDLKQLALSQKCTSPEQAFDQRKTSEFPIRLLQKQQEAIEAKDKNNLWSFKPIKCLLEEDDKGSVKLVTTNLPREHHYPIVPEWEDKRGLVTIYEMPLPGAPPLTYFGGVDTVEADETHTSHSIMTVDIYQKCVKIVYTENGKQKVRYDGGKIVATYRGRFNPVEKANEQAWLLIKMYNAFTWVERSKPNFINYMKRNGRAERYLAKESDVPIFKNLSENAALSNSNIGFIISSTNKMWDVLKSNVKEYMYQEFDRRELPNGEVVKVYRGIDRWDDYWALEEYIKYNEKGNFDRIISSAAAITIGKVYENELGIKTVNVDVKPQQIQEYKAPKSINMLGGATTTRRSPRSLL